MTTDIINIDSNLSDKDKYNINELVQFFLIAEKDWLTEELSNKLIYMREYMSEFFHQKELAEIEVKK